MMRHATALALLLGFVCVAAPSARAADTLEPVELNGPTDNRIDLVIVGDGYTAAQADLFRQHADALLAGLFVTPPWSAYRGAFNLYRVVTESAESGADHPSQNFYVDTYFDAQFDYLGIERLVYANETKVIAVVTGLLPEVDQIVLVVNDAAYGGSGGSVSMVSVNVYAIGILTHELGHSFADLADEYTDPYPGYPPGDPEVNVDFDSTFELIKWNAWIEAGTPLPTLMSDAVDDYHPVGAYEGARFLDTGIFRPAPSCMMRSLEYDYCDVCREALVLAVYERVALIDDVTPVPGVRNVDLGDPASHPLRFSVAPLDMGSAGGLSVAWLLDGVEIAQGSELALDPVAAGIEAGDHELLCIVTDDGPWVRNDPEDLLALERSWTLRVTGTPVDAGVVGDDAGPGDGGGPSGCGCQSSGDAPAVPIWFLLVLGWGLSSRRRGCRTRGTAC